MDNQFQILLKAVLDASGIGESDISRVQKVVDKYTVNLATELDTAKLLKTVKAVVPELEAELKKITGVDIKIDDKTILKTINQVVTETRKATAEQEKLTQAMAKGREQAELQAQAELKRQEIAQSNAANKAIEQEYSQRQKLTQSIDEQALKIRQMQSEGSIQLSFDKIEAQYNKLEKLGLVTDSLINNFAQLKQSFNSFDPSGKSENAVNDYTKLNLQLKSVKNSMSSIATTAPKVNKSILSIEKLKLTNQIDTWMRVNTKADQFNGRLEKIKSDISALDDMSGLPELRKQFQEVNSEADKLGLKGKSLSDKLWSGMKDFASWTFGSSMIMQGVQSFKQALSELKDVNSILTEISKTSERTASQLKTLGDTSFETASKYGNKASNYLLGVQEMSRAGYENSEQMAELSTLAQSAGDMTAELANDYLIASDAAYGYSGNIKKLTALLDGQNQITNRNAVSMEELANATKVAGSMLSNVTNISENKLSALLGTGIATSRESGETVARAIKSIMMNLQQVAGEGGFEGEIIDEESLKKVESRCHGIGVELEYMADGMVKLRDPMVVLKELADVYNSLPKDSAERAGIIADIGGKYRANVLSSILSNWDKYEKMLGDYENSAGSAFEEAMKSANNWEGSLNRLSNTWTDIVGNIANSDGIIVGINALNSLFEVVNKLTSVLGTVGTAGAGVGIAAFIKNLDWLKMQSYNKILPRFFGWSSIGKDVTKMVWRTILCE